MKCPSSSSLTCSNTPANRDVHPTGQFYGPVRPAFVECIVIRNPDTTVDCLCATNLLCITGIKIDISWLNVFFL